MLDRIKEVSRNLRNYPYLSKFKKLVIETPIEVAIGAVAIGAVAGIASYEHEDSKLGQIPVAFSEAGHTKKVLGRQGKEVPPLTRFYGVTNDVAMMVFEANNLGYSWDHSHPKFAYELEKKIEPTFRIQTLISDYAPQSKEMMSAALRKIYKASSAMQDIQPAIQALDKAWDDEHHDRYRTEVYTTTQCTTSSNGKTSTTTCRPVVQTRQVYDHTDHYYTYDRQQGRLAAKLLKEFVAKHPDIKIDEALLRVTETGAENEWAMRQSRNKLSGYKDLKQEDYIRLANTWATGSNYAVSMPKAYQSHAGVLSMTPQWAAANMNARSAEYRTYSHHDNGPQEFQIAEAALKYAVDMSRSVSKVHNGIVFAGENVPLLNHKISEYVNAALHGGEGNENKLRQEVMSLAREIYAKNYEGGFDTAPFKTGSIVLWTVMGMLAGAALGFGADRAIRNSQMSKDHFKAKRDEYYTRNYGRSYR